MIASIVELEGDFGCRISVGVPATVDPARLAQQLREVQSASVRQMRAFGQAMDDVLARMPESGERR